ncbi:hypothetical protein [Paraburkholderia sp. EG304]|uniref:hypothetical protein n=1 Tax=Paraburkholderia sp. EG304 TaxID=3237015 RepID=UPI00397C7EA8
MKVEDRRAPQRRRYTRWYAASLSTLVVTAITWLSAIVDLPIDDAIVAGMTAPQCARVGSMPSGSVLLAALPDDAICRSFFLYRATTQNAAMDAPSYTNMIMQERVGEFWKMIGYVLLLWLLASATVVGLARQLKRFFTCRMHRS